MTEEHCDVDNTTQYKQAMASMEILCHKTSALYSWIFNSFEYFWSPDGILVILIYQPILYQVSFVKMAS